MASPSCWSYSRRQVPLWDGASLVHRRSKDSSLGPEGRQAGRTSFEFRRPSGPGRGRSGLVNAGI